MEEQVTLDFAIFIDIESRDGEICRRLCLSLVDAGFDARCFALSEEPNVLRDFSVGVSVINKPHFFMWHRIKAKLEGVKFVVLDTEGVLPGLNRQHVLIEPEGYIHWFAHQKERYKFKKTIAATVGYVRRGFISAVPNKRKAVVTVASNFSVLGYSEREIKNRYNDRKLKLQNDWSLLEYFDFQKEALKVLKEILKHNSGIEFHIKPHPNDPASLWDEIELGKNVKLVDGRLSIGCLFEAEPTAHLCMDGCTTILDAYLAGIPSITFGRFPAFDHSMLNSLGVHRLQPNEVASLPLFFDHIEPKETKTFSLAEQHFLQETQNFNVGQVVETCCSVLERKAHFKFYDAPTGYHFRYWFLSFLKSVFGRKTQQSSRKKINNA